MNTPFTDMPLPSKPASSSADAFSQPDAGHPIPPNTSSLPSEDVQTFAKAMDCPQDEHSNHDSKEQASPSHEASDQTFSQQTHENYFSTLPSLAKPDTHKEANSPSTKRKIAETTTPDQAPLASLFAGRFDGLNTPESTIQVSLAPSANVDIIAENLAKSILVSEVSATGQEIRIQPSSDILPDTEICLIRSPDGLLSAIIHTDNPTAFQAIVEAQHDLRERLELHEGRSVRVQLRSSADDADPRRRSRGLDLQQQD